jgi:hypothetical protein
MISGVGGSKTEAVAEEHPPEYYISLVQNELCNAAAAQERYHAANQEYAYRIEDLKAQGYAPTDGVTLYILSSTNYYYRLQFQLSGAGLLKAPSLSARSLFLILIKILQSHINSPIPYKIYNVELWPF